MPNLLQELRERAARSPASIVLAEGGDPRVVAAAERAAAERLCRVSVVGTQEQVERAAAEAGVRLTVPILDPISEPDLPHLVARLAERLQARGMAQAQEAAESSPAIPSTTPPCASSPGGRTPPSWARWRPPPTPCAPPCG